MFKRSAFLLIMGAAVVLPYLATSTDVFSRWTGGGEKTAGGSAGGWTSGGTGASGAAAQVSKGPKIEGQAVQDLNEILRFDGTPGWVMSRWPRVTAGLAELDLQGYRVPLVTGTGEQDLAGSLTYYFDKNQQMAYINFRGSTGDPRKLISLVTSRYSFLPQKTDDPGLALYQVRWNGQALSELRIRTSRIVRADQPHARYDIELAMKRP
jgi:hypothetical protein